MRKTLPYSTRAESGDLLNEDFLLELSHELKNPLANLKLNLELAKNDLTNKRPHLGDNDFLVSSLTRGVEQVNFISTLLDKFVYGRYSGAKEEVVDLSTIIYGVVDSFSAQLKMAQIDIELSLIKNIKGSWNRNDIEQVLINLIVNVIKYAPNCTLRIEIKQSGNLALLTLQDSGPGIPLGLQERIFNKYVRGHEGTATAGLGLGLHIVKEIVQANHGRIQLLNQTKGTGFLIELPL